MTEANDTIYATHKSAGRQRGGQVYEVQELMEPTIGLEPMTCRLRIDCSTN